MNVRGTANLRIITLLVILSIVAVSVLPIVAEQTEQPSQMNTLTIDEEEIYALLNNTISEITTLLQIKHSYGHFDRTDKTGTLQQLALMITPFHDTPVSLTDIVVTLTTADQIYFVLSSGQIDNVTIDSLFNHPLWAKTPAGQYSILTLIDHDSSLSNYQLIDDSTDAFYLLISIPEDALLHKGAQFSITLSPSQGIYTTKRYQVPLPIKEVVTLSIS